MTDMKGKTRIVGFPDGIISPAIWESGVFRIGRKNNRRINVTVEHVAVIFEDNPRVNVTADPKRKRPSPHSSKTACHFSAVMKYTLRRTTRRIASGFYWRPPEFFSGFSTGFIMQNVGFSAHSYRGLPRRSFRQPLYRSSLIMFTWRELEENAAGAYAHRAAAFPDNVN